MSKNFQKFINIEKFKFNNDLIPVLFNEKNECCGCSLCYVICLEQSSGAIQMVKDSEGFLYPQIDLARCVCCHKCVNNCTFLETGDIYEKKND